MNTEEIQKKIRHNLIPEAIRALEDRLNDPDKCSPADIKLAFELGKRFAVNLDDNLEKVEKSSGVLTELKGFNRVANG
jgi:hypothetical protein